MRVTSLVRATRRVPLLQVVKTAVAAVLAWFAATAVFPDQVPVFASVAALLVVQPSVNQSFGKALERSVGVIVGVLVAMAAVLVFGDPDWLVLAAIVASLIVAWALRLTPASSVQIPISAMLVLSIGAATPEYASARIVETLIGAAVGLTINVAIVAPLQLAPGRLAVLRLGRRVADELERLADALTRLEGREDLEAALLSARELRELQQAAGEAMRSARDSLTLNPRRSRYRDRLEEDVALLARFEVLVTRVIGMARAMRDHWDPALRGEPWLAGIAEELRRAAHDLRLLIEDGEDPVGSTELPALTAPLVLPTPNPNTWILVGSLMEDLRRVREAIVGE